MALTIDELNIKIATESAEAINGLDKLLRVLEKLNKAVTPAANRMEQASKKIEKIGTSANKSSKSYGSLLAKVTQSISQWRTLMSVFQNAANTMADWFTASNDYIETLNLFNVTMGEASEGALEFANSVSTLMGIDVADWMQYQGTFKQLTSGFGVAAEKADIMSQNLTQLSYDMASFFNTDVETAFDKLSSAMSGQVKGLREFGIDTTVASLQQYALAQGIEKSVSKMSQAEKSLLRYNYIMEKSILIQGDMARTIGTPANALRILNAQLDQMKRALGNIVSVLVTKFIPYVQLMVKTITEAATAIASFFGFELPKIDYSGLGGSFSDDMEEAEDSLNGASGALKKIKKQLMGFDELNIINEPDTSSGSGGASSAGLDDITSSLIPAEYNFLDSLISQNLRKVKDELKDVLIDATAIAGVIAGWKIYEFAKGLDASHSLLKKISKIAAGLVISIAGWTLEFSGAKEIGNGTAGIWDVIKTIIGAALGVVGSLITFGTGPVGWIIGIAASLTVFLVGFTIGYNEKLVQEDLEKRFGELELSDATIKEWAEKLTSTELTLQLNLFISEQETLNSLKDQVETAIQKLRGYNFRIDIGLDVDYNSYEIAINNFIDSAQEYANQKHVVAALAVKVLFGEDSETGESLTSSVNSVYGELETELTSLGTKLKETISEGFVDGVWIEDKYAEALKLQSEIQEILDYITNVEYEAGLENLKLNLMETEITADSFTSVLEEANTLIETNLKNLEAVKLENLKIAKMTFDQNIANGMSEEAAQEIYDDTCAEIQQKFMDGKLDLTYGTYDFGLGIIQEKYQEEIDKTIPIMQQDTRKMFSQASMTPGGLWLPEDETYQNVQTLVMQLYDAYDYAFETSGITHAASQNIKKLTKSLQPTEEQLTEIARQSRAAGESVPENVVKGLNDINQLKAIGGGATAIHYLIGQHLSTDPEFLETLATCEGAGKDINEYCADGLLNNLQIVEDAASGTVTFINDTIGEKTIEVTPELVENMKDLGINLSDGLLKGAEDEMENNKSSWLDWAIWPWNWFKKKNEINSPSKLFTRGGEDIMQGLWNGLENIWKKISNWWSGLGFPELDFKMPHFEWTTTPASGWMSDVLGALGLPTSLPKLNVSWYASGGIPNMGEMFIARESGPELVGQIGRKNAVANNDQIIEGISAGVYRAMMAANGGNGKDITVNATFEMDGEVVGKKVIKYHNGVVMQTGESPLLV